MITTAQMRRKLLRPPFANPYYDSSDPKLWREEIKIISRIAAGEGLVMDREYIAEQDCYAVLWYWNVYPNYPAEYDVPITLLMSRGVLRQVCAGGYATMTFTEAAKEALGLENFEDEPIRRRPIPA